MKRASTEGSKLFKVLVLGGLSMAVPACSGGTVGDDAGAGADSAADQASPDDAAGNDAAPPGDASVDDAACPPDKKYKCPDCTHGICGW